MVRRRQVGVIDGQERLISARNLAHYPVAVVATMTVADALANWKRGAITMVVTALIAGLVIGSTVFISIWMVGRRLREQSLQRDAALNNMSQGLAMFDSAGRLVVCNDRYRKMYDFPPDLVRPGCKLLDLLKYRFRNGSYPSDPEEYVRDLPAKIAQGKMTRHVVQAGDGRIVTVTNRLMTNGGWVATHEDITEAKRQEEALARANQELIEKQYAIDQAVTVAITDVKGDIIYVNDNFCRISGYSREELLGNNHRILNSGTHPNTFFRDLYHKITNGHVWRGEVCNKAKNGSLYWVDTTIVPQLGSDGKPVAYMAIRVDITARKLAEEKISYMANHDALTGVGNRALLYEKLGEVLARLRRHQETFTVLLLDLDGFKHINDTLGHAVGDNLLKELAGRLNFALRETDTLTRLGGDEFAIIQHNETNQREAAITLAVRLLEIVSAPFHLEGHDVTVGASIGVSIAPEDGIDAGELIQKADLALYRVKSEGRNNFRFFDAEMSKSATERLRLLADMRAALAHKEFELHYQPVFDTKTLRPCGVEALVRWRHPTDGLISPDRFIALAEETGLMEQLGDWILEKACTDAVLWPHDIKVAINLSAVQFRSGNLFDVILCALVESGLPPERLELEITESVLMQNAESYSVVLQQLKNIGVSIVLDDFGTGYSSLSYLTMFPFDKIKIDKSFTQGLINNAGCAAIVASVLSLARGLGVAVTAEGIETNRQFELLRAAGVHQIQGYLFARPCPVVQLNFTAFEQRGQAVEAA